MEVKGPGDTPQENQKLWFDALLRANAAVEICKVIDIATDNNPTKGKKRKVKTPASSSRRKKHAQLVDSDSEGESYDQMNQEQERELSEKADTHPGSGKRRRLTKPEDMDDLSLHQPMHLSPSISRIKGHFDR